MIHYHGTPLTPNAQLERLVGRHFCVSFWRPDQTLHVVRLGQSLMLDNGAFSAWRKGEPVEDWAPFYEWVEPLLEFPANWAVIPDVIDGDEDDNDRLLVDCFKRRQRRSARLGQWAPVWHMHESLDRLWRLCNGYTRVCIGSSAQYKSVGTRSWHDRMAEAMDRICDPEGRPPVWLHMLRGMGQSGGPYPFASVDSTDLARNGHREGNDVVEMANRWDGMQTPPRWVRKQFAFGVAA